MSDIHLIIAVVLPLTVASVGKCVEPTDHGVAVPLAERRGVVGVHTAEGENLVIACSTDLSPRGWILVTDIDTGESEQIWAPEGVPNGAPYGSCVASNGKYYTSQGDWLLEFDPSTWEWTFSGRPAPAASAYLRIIEGPEGRIWLGDVYRAGLSCYDPQTQEMTDYGPMDEEKYLSHIGFDDAGWIYCGIGTARTNLVAFHPETGEKRSLIPDDERKVGTGYTYTGTDGNAYGRATGQWYRLHDGEATNIEKADAAEAKDMGDIYWGDVKARFPDGRRVSAYNFQQKYLDVYDPETETTETIEFDYESEGTVIRVLTDGPGDKIYANSAHPSRFIVFDPATDTLEYRPGPIALKGFGVQGDYVFGGHYGGGKLYVYDTTKPWNLTGTAKALKGATGAQQLVEAGNTDDGRLLYLDSHDVALFLSDEYGGETHFDLHVPEDGEYWLLIATYQAPTYCAAQLLLDGEPLGEPFDAKASTVIPGPILDFGPLELSEGMHRLTVRTLEDDSENPWISLRAVKFTDDPSETSVSVPEKNPELVKAFAPDINVPWGAAAHPDGEHILISGSPGYGYIGGGIGIYNITTGESQLLPHTDLIENHSIRCMEPLPDGDIVCGTSVSGGHGTSPVADDAVICVLDWEAKTVSQHDVPVKDLSEIRSIVRGPEGLLYCLGTNGLLFSYDLQSQGIIAQADLSDYGSVAVNPMTLGPEGNLYVVLRDAVLQVGIDGLEVAKICDAPGPINAGIGLVDGRVYFARGSHLWSVPVP